MRIKFKRSIVLAIVFCFMVSVVNPGGTFAVYAYSTAKPAQVKSLKSTEIKMTTVTLKWKKVKGAAGYEVRRNNRVVKRLGKNSFKDSKLKSGKIYTYTVRAYKTYRQKQYYNSKTRKWVKDRPVNSEWKGKKTRLATKRRYGLPSAELKLITKVKSSLADRIPILTFHRIVSDEVKEAYFKDDQWVAAISDFEEQIEYLYENDYKIITLQEFEAWYDGKVKLPRKTAVLTFDDGDYEMYYLVYPVLKKYGFSATAFIIGERTKDVTPEYKEERARRCLGRDLISLIREEYPELQFQSHTYDLHTRTADGGYLVDTKTYDEIDSDFKQNEEFGFEYIAYPFGQFTDDLKEAAKNNGMRMGFAFRKYVCATRLDDRFEIPRVKINGQITFKEFVSKLKSFLK